MDYSLHIGHAYLVHSGTRRERVLAALAHLGPSVLAGGVSTFLTVAALSLAEGYIFRVFFRSFAFAVLFGLFHGLVVLPVLLLLIGGPGYVLEGASGRPVATVVKSGDVAVTNVAGGASVVAKEVEIGAV